MPHATAARFFPAPVPVDPMGACSSAIWSRCTREETAEALEGEANEGSCVQLATVRIVLSML